MKSKDKLREQVLQDMWQNAQFPNYGKKKKDVFYKTIRKKKSSGKYGQRT